MNNSKIQRREVKRSQPMLFPVNVTIHTRKIPCPLTRSYPLRFRRIRNASLTRLQKLFRETS